MPDASLLTLIKAQVWMYKSFADSTPGDIAEDVTMFVGKNESAKTAFLDAVHKALPLDKAKYDDVADYPGKDLVRYRPQHEAKNYGRVAQLTLRIEQALADKINTAVFGGGKLVWTCSTFQRDTTIERKRVLDFSMFIEPQPSEADMEDLVPQDAYIAAFNAAYAKELKGTALRAKDLGKEPRIVARIDKWLATKKIGLLKIGLLKDGGFNHYRVAQALLQSLKADSFKPAELARFERLFAEIAEVL